MALDKLKATQAVGDVVVGQSAVLTIRDALVPTPGNDLVVVGVVNKGGEEIAYLAYDVRTPVLLDLGDFRVIGRIDREVAVRLVAEAVERVAQAVWGPDWSRALAEIAGLNHRTSARDRVYRYGLPPRVVAALGLLQREDAPPLAGVLRSLARYHDAYGRLPITAGSSAARILAAFRGVEMEELNAEMDVKLTAAE